MGLKKYTIITELDNETRTVVTDYRGLIFKTLIYNDSIDTNTFEMYIDNGAKMYHIDLQPNQTIELKPEIRLDIETLKVYGSLKGLHIIVEILED